MFIKRSRPEALKAVSSNLGAFFEPLGGGFLSISEGLVRVQCWAAFVVSAVRVGGVGGVGGAARMAVSMASLPIVASMVAFCLFALGHASWYP